MKGSIGFLQGRGALGMGVLGFGAGFWVGG